MKVVLLRISLFCYVLVFCLFASNIAAQCTLAIDSTVSTNVTCNGDSNGTITVYASGGKGTVTYSTGGGNVIVPTQPFSSNVINNDFGSGPTDEYYSPSSSEGGAYWQYSSTQGCPAGSAVYQGNTNSYTQSYLRTPEVNMDGIDTVQITFDLTNNASGASDYLNFYVWVDNNYQTLPITVNGVSTTDIYFGTANNCALTTVTVDLSSIPTDSRSDFLFYFSAYCENSIDCSGYLAEVDNITISQASTGQTSNSFTGLPAGIYNITVTDTAGCTATITDTITQPTALTATASSTSPTTVGGANGTATAIVSGGTKPYSYTWGTSPVQHADTATGLATGGYTVTVTDHNGCSATASVGVPAHSCTGFGFSSIDSTNVACYGNSTGSITVSATGGTPPYQYELENNGYQASGDFTGLAAGTYEVAIKDSAGCTDANSNVIILQPASALSLKVDTEGATSAGNNGKIIAVASGGTSPYQYSINGTNYQASDTFSGVAGDKTYCVTVEDSHDCIDTACGFVSQSTCPTITIHTAVDSVSCFGNSDGSVTITASGGATPYQYSLNGGTTYQAIDSFTGLAANSYAVSVKDNNGCTAASSVTVYQPGELSASVVTDSVLCSGGNTGEIIITPSGGTGPYQYSLNGGAFQADNTYSGLLAGTDTVNIKDVHGCTTVSYVTVSQPAPLEVNVGTASTTTVGGSDGKAYALASGGAGVYRYLWSNTPAGTLDSITGLSTGNYCVTVTDLNNCTVSGCGTVSPPNCSGFTLTDSVTNASSATSKDGAIDITFIGATLPIVFAWNNGDSTQNISGLGVGQYCVKATDALGCIANLCDSVRNDLTTCYGLIIDSIQVTNPSCPYVDEGVIVVYTKGGLGTIQYSIDSGTTFVISNMFDTLFAGSYYVEVKDTNGCVVHYADNPVTVTAPPGDTLNITQDGDTLIASNYPNTIYQWYWNNTPAPGVDSLQTYILNSNFSGAYRAQAYDTITGCNYPSIVVGYTGITSINGQPVDMDIYPNPFSEALNVTINSPVINTVEVELFDLLGNKLYADKPSGNSFTIPTSTLAQGMYLIRLQLNGQFVYRQVVKE